MNVTSSLQRRIEPSSVTALLAVGDLIAIATFVVAGEISHGYSLVADVGRIAGTLVQFLVGWSVVSLAGGLYTPDAIADLRSAVSWTLPAWAAAVVIAQALRSTPVFHGDAALAFALVSFGVVGVLLVFWRVVAAIVF